jgi:hypothetical protein
MIELASEFTAAAVAVNAAEVWAKEICTVAGTVTADVLADVATVTLPVVGAVATVTVQMAVAELLIEAGAQVKPVIWTGAGPPMLIVAVCVWLFKDAVIVAFWAA